MTTRKEKHRGFHWHPGEAHSHEHDEEGHHGHPWGRTPKVIDVELLMQLKQSVRKVQEAKANASQDTQ